MVIDSWLVLAGLSKPDLDELVRRIPADSRRGRPHACSLVQRILLTAVALRTNLTVRELAVMAGLAKSTLHRIVASITPRLAAVMSALHDRPLRVGPRRDTHPDPRSSPRREVQELPLVVQCPDPDSPLRPRRRRLLGGWAWKPQRPDSLPRISHRVALPRPSTSPGRRRLSRRRGAAYSALPPSTHRPRSEVANPSPASSAGRARDRPTQELACSP